MKPRLLLTAAIALCASLLNACDEAARPTAPVSVSEAVAGGKERLVTMMDACDPESFNAADVTCVRSGGVTFQRFLELLRKHRAAGAWHLSPGTLNARVGQTLLAVNRRGEEHTFTEVEEFGGGRVEALNQLSGNPVPAPECLNLARATSSPRGPVTLTRWRSPGRSTISAASIRGCGWMSTRPPDERRPQESEAPMPRA